VPAEIRRNPFAAIPTLGMSDLKKGVYTLVNQGYLPTSHVDLTPALDRNDPLVQTKPVSPQELLRQESVVALRAGLARLKALPLASSDDASTVSQPGAGFAQPDAVAEPRTALVTVPPLGPGLPLEAQSGSEAPFASTRRRERQVPTAAELLRVKNQRYLEVANSQLVRDERFVRLKSLHLLAWGDLLEVAGKVVAFAAARKVASFRIFFSRLQDLGWLMREPTAAELASCVENFESSAAFAAACGVKAESGAERPEKLMRVAVKIQKNFRKLVARRLRAQLADIRRKIVMIQFKYKLKRVYQETVRRADETKARKYKQYLQVHQRFVEDWPALAAGPRVEVHLCNLGSRG
jgi:hypothetical protein